MTSYFVLSAVGSDHPGIVAEVAGAIYECGCNLEDSRTALLGSQFSLMILLSGRSEAADELQERCKRLQGEKDLKVFLFPLETRGQEPPPEAPAPNHEIRVVGLDRAGIVYRTSKLIASHGINIGDMETRVDPAPESGSPVFTMHAMLTVPQEVELGGVREELEALADELHVEISLNRVGSAA
jgi:glycine cleavage system transcriptional repressor